MKFSILIFCVFTFFLNWHTATAQTKSDWQSVSRIKNQTTHVVPAFWQDLPKLNAKTRNKILDVDGPGVISMFHSSAFVAKGEGIEFNLDSYVSGNVILRVFYDNEEKPSIEMPLMDFFADIQSKSKYFHSIYFSKVKESHNFRLPIPFRKHITVEIENPTDKNLTGYIDIQWEKVAHIPSDCGYLRTYYREGIINPKIPLSLFELNKPGTIVAHWLQYESVKSFGNGNLICEGNQEICLDGDELPTLNYMGTEDVYGFSWGFRDIASDNYVAIVKREDLKPSGQRIAVLRCRENDVISFRKSCKWVITYLTDPGTVKRFGNSQVPFRHCVYYYSK